MYTFIFHPQIKQWNCGRKCQFEYSLPKFVHILSWSLGYIEAKSWLFSLPHSHNSPILFITYGNFAPAFGRLLFQVPTEGCITHCKVGVISPYTPGSPFTRPFVGDITPFKTGLVAVFFSCKLSGYDVWSAGMALSAFCAEVCLFPKGRKRDWFKSPVFQREFQLNHAKVVPGYPGASIQKGILRIQSYSANAKTGLHTWWKNVEEKWRSQDGSCDRLITSYNSAYRG